MLKLEYRYDVVPLIESMVDNPKECYGEAPKWDRTKNDDNGEQQEVFNKKLDMYLNRETMHIRNKRKAYTLLYGQCAP